MPHKDKKKDKFPSAFMGKQISTSVILKYLKEKNGKFKKQGKKKNG